ncbi:MAG: ABC transporter permease [Candidatus Aminicenantes bacterium]|nr:ABC transporter permease [Candidatus Aminicenantes bacterium]
MKRAFPDIPQLAERIPRLLYSKDYYLERSGDLEEAYADLMEKSGPFRAKVWLWFQLLKLCFGILRTNIVWGFIMLKNYLKITIRNIKRHKSFSFINMAGLVVGMTCFLLILVYVYYELSYDSMHEKADQIYRVAFKHPGTSYMGFDSHLVTPSALAPALMEGFPEVSHATRFRVTGRLLLSGEEKSFYAGGLFADEQFFDVFSFRLVSGSKKYVLKNPESIIITPQLARKFFGNEDPIGKTLACSLGEFEIVGILENVPENSHIQFDWLIPFASLFRAEERESKLFDWIMGNYYTYCVLKTGSDSRETEKKLTAFMSKINKGLGREKERMYFLQSLRSIHLKSHIGGEFSVNSDIKIIRLFFIVAVFILLIACVNFINLSTAHASKRAKEIGIRKVLGSTRFHLFRQFIWESILISVASLFLALSFSFLLLPVFNRFSGRTVVLNALFDWHLLLGIAAVLVATGLLAGLYPALVLSSLQPVDVLKKKTGGIVKGGMLRNILVLSQFSITIMLIFSSLVIIKQMRYIKNTDIGYNREQIVTVRVDDPEVKKNLASLKQSILESPNIIGVATSSSVPTNVGSAFGMKCKSEDGEEIEVHNYWLGIDHNFIDVFQMEMVHGRNFSKEFGTDAESAVIVNESFVKEVNWNQPVGKKIPLFDMREVIGVVKDFHFHSLHMKIKPLTISISSDSRYLHARIRTENLPATLAYIKEVYDRFKIKYPFEYFFLDDQFNKMYQAELKLGTMLMTFSGLAIFIACLGVFGLAIYTAERRIKEIGIRKVLGASIPSILGLFYNNLTRWILIANILAWPAAYFFMSKWLQNFAYRTNIGLWVFVVSAASVIFIALLTVSFQSVKAATANPVDSLRYE